MKVIVEIRRERDPLTRDVWRFRVEHPLMVRCDYYVSETRPSKRHRVWKVTSRWSRFRLPYDRAEYLPSLPMPDDVLEEAMQRALKELRAEATR
jgi:hypothetical protein